VTKADAEILVSAFGDRLPPGSCAVSWSPSIRQAVRRYTAGGVSRADAVTAAVDEELHRRRRTRQAEQRERMRAALGCE
jgi:hypothetical protein